MDIIFMEFPHMKAHVASGVVGVGTGIGPQIGKGGPVEMETAGGHVFSDPDHGMIGGIFQAVGFKGIRFLKVVFMTSAYYREDRPETDSLEIQLAGPSQ